MVSIISGCRNLIRDLGGVLYMHYAWDVPSVSHKASCMRNFSVARPPPRPWFVPPPPPPPQHLHDDCHPLVVAVSRAVAAAPSTPLDVSLRPLLPKFTPALFADLLAINPLSLPPLPLLSLFHHVSSPRAAPHFRHTPLSYLAMATHLLRAGLPSHARPLLRLLVARRGRRSAPALFAVAAEVSAPALPPPALIDALVLEYAEAGFLFDAVHCLRLARRCGLPFPLKACSRILDHYIKSASTAAAWDFYAEILDAGYPPKVTTFNVLIHSFCKEKRVEDAKLVFDAISRYKLVSTVVSFNTLINGYCKVGNLDFGFELKRRMLEVGLRPDVFTYSVLLRGLCKAGRLEDANELFEEMCDRGLAPNAVTFTTLIDGHCKNGNIKGAMEVYQEMLKRGVVPDLITFNALVNVLCKSSDLRAAKDVVEEMRRRRLKPDKITYTTLMDGCCKEGDLEMSIAIKKVMAAEGIELDEVTYTTLISGLCREGWIEDANTTLHEMVKAGMLPDVATYTMVIDAFCKRGQVKMGFKLLKEMQSKGHKPGVVTYNVIMNGLCKLGQMKNANMLLNAMLNIEIAPDDITYNILLEGHCKHGNILHHEELRGEIGMISDFAAYTSLIKELVKKLNIKKKREKL